MLRAINAHLDGMQRIRSMPAGILSELPDWVPDPLVKEFSAVRSHLVMWYGKWSGDASPSYETACREIAKLMRARFGDWQPGPNPGSGTVYPQEIEDKLDALLYISQLAAMGPEGAIDAYLGRSGNKIYRGIVLKERMENARASRGSSSPDILKAVQREEDKGTPSRAINKIVATDLKITPRYVAKVRKAANK